MKHQYNRSMIIKPYSFSLLRSRHSQNPACPIPEPERGSAIFLILIGIVMFAALSFVVGGMLRGGNTDMIDEEKAKLYAGEILNYARAIRSATQHMKISNGCSDVEISFERPPFNGSDSCYVNPNNTDNYSCFVFHKDGGNITYMEPPQGSTSDETALFDFTGCNTGHYFFDIRRHVKKIGNDGPFNSETGNDILVRLQVNKAVCTAINKKISNTTDIPTDGWPYWEPARDLYNTQPQTHLTCSDNGCVGKPTYCFLQTNGPAEVHQFYSVVVVR